VSVNITNARIRVALTLLALVLFVLIPAGFRAVVQSAFADSSIVDSSVGVSSANVHIGVLGLFHPHEFTVSAPVGYALLVRAGEERIVLEKSSGVDSANIRISAGITSASEDGEDREVVVTAGRQVVRAPKVTISNRGSEPVDFLLSIPQKITRHYRGTLEIKPSSGTLIAIVAMDRETAVASVVAAESTSDTPLEALKAQAVATRSYLVASMGRHREFDFCDTTHCQFLREPPASSTAAANATAATRGLVIAYDSHPIAAMYTRSCSGRTRTPVELGLSPSAGAYPYYAVECKHCRAHPVRWSSRISAQDAATLHSSGESARLNIDRRLGWNAVPSNDFVVKTEPDQSMHGQSMHDQIVVEGTGQGHGIGLCQSGARAMAEEGADFRQILSHYYPNTTVVAAR
jgi:stage II sporulation protein D (peptidoglycan lytic transglycosylase)